MTIARLLYQLYKWLFFIPFFGINTILHGTLAVLLSKTINQKVGSFVGGVLWARINAFFTPIFVKVKGKENINKNQSYVIIANHLSAYDIFVLYGWLGIDFKWVMKKELRKVPGLGYGSEAVGHIFLDRSNTKAAIDSMNAAKKKLVNGLSVVFFPEGTRSKTREMLPFKKGAFKFALDAQLPILPLTINGSDKILPTGTLDLFPGRAEIIIHKPIDIKSYDNENIKSLMDLSREVIASARKF